MKIVPTWSLIRKIGHTRLAKATILIPIIGYFVIFNDQLTSYLHLIPALSNKPIDHSIDAANLTRLICLYIGLFCIGVGSFIFVLVCPDQIFDPDNEHNFITKEIEIMTPLRFGSAQQELNRLKAIAPANMHGTIDKLAVAELSDSVGIPDARTDELRGRGLVWTDWINRNKNTISECLSVLYHLQDNSRWFIRLVIGIVYLIGFGFLAWPSAVVFIRTAKTLIGI